MPDMQDFFPAHFYTNVPLLYILLMIGLSAAYAYFVYHRTVPPITNGYRVFLGFLRGAAVFLILILLFAPQLILEWRYESKAKVAVLIDRSASIALEDRRQEEQEVLAQLTSKLQDRVELIPYFFNTDTFAVNSSQSDSLRFATDIEKGLASVAKARPGLNAMLLISDGNVSAGANPLFSAKRENMPVFTIGLGDSVAPPDIAVNRIEHNKFVYQDKPFEVRVEITGRNTDQHRSKLILRRGNKIIQALAVDIPGDGSSVAVPMTLKSSRLGLNTYSVEIEPLEQETIRENNKKDFSLVVLKGKLKVGLIAGQPSVDAKFIQTTLQDLPGIRISSAIDRPGGGSYLQTVSSVLDSADVLVLCDFPGPFTSQRTLQQVNSALKTENKPLMYLMLSPLPQKRRNFISQRFALSNFRFSPEKFSGQVRRGPLAKAAGSWLNIYDTEEKNSLFWSLLPPVNLFVRSVRAGNGVQSLLLAAGDDKPVPVLLSTRGGNSKNLLFVGSEFWRWKFLLAENNEYSTGWSILLNNAIRWLSFKGDSQNIVVSLDKDEYEAGESVTLTTQIYDEQFRPVNDGVVKLTVTNADGSFELTAENKGSGSYESRFPALVSGEYRIKAEAWQNDITLGEIQKTFHVAHLNSEFLITAQNVDLLRNLARQSGGKYADHSNMAKLIPDLSFPPSNEIIKQHTELWNKLITLLVIIGLFTLEWFVRKRRGLS